jgi:hypothetical protein
MAATGQNCAITFLLLTLRPDASRQYELPLLLLAAEIRASVPLLVIAAEMRASVCRCSCLLQIRASVCRGALRHVRDASQRSSPSKQLPLAPEIGAARLQRLSPQQNQIKRLTGWLINQSELTVRGQRIPRANLLALRLATSRAHCRTCFDAETDRRGRPQTVISEPSGPLLTKYDALFALGVRVMTSTMPDLWGEMMFCEAGAWGSHAVDQLCRRTR